MEERISLNSAMALEHYLEENFQPAFEQYEAEDKRGLPIRDVIQRLNSAEVMDRIPENKRSRIVKKYDRDNDGYITYQEFRTLVMSERDQLDLKELSRFQKFVLGAVRTVVKRGDDIQYIDEYSCKPPPLFIIFISLVELIIFIVYAVELQGTAYAVTADNGFPPYSPLIFNPKRRWEAWRFITYMFIHVGYVHLIANMLFQLLLGIPLEMVHHWWRVLLVYILGVLAGSLAHSIFDPSIMLAGASGGAYALIAAHLANVIMNWSEMNHEWNSNALNFLSSAPFRLTIILLLAGGDTAFAIYQRYATGSSNTGFAAHFGGALSGLLIGIPVLRNLHEKPWERIFFWVAIIIYCVAVLFAVLWNGFWPGFPDTDWKPCCVYP